MNKLTPSWSSLLVETKGELLPSLVLRPERDENRTREEGEGKRGVPSGRETPSSLLPSLFLLLQRAPCTTSQPYSRDVLRRESVYPESSPPSERVLQPLLRRLFVSLGRSKEPEYLLLTEPVLLEFHQSFGVDDGFASFWRRSSRDWKLEGWGGEVADEVEEGRPLSFRERSRRGGRGTRGVWVLRREDRRRHGSG